MDNFISDSPFKMPPMNVKVMDNHGNCIKEYSAPAGLQLERYLADQYPKHRLDISFPNKTFTVKIHDSGGRFIETHCGVYTEKIDF